MPGRSSGTCLLAGGTEDLEIWPESSRVGPKAVRWWSDTIRQQSIGVKIGGLKRWITYLSPYLSRNSVHLWNAFSVRGLAGAMGTPGAFAPRASVWNRFAVGLN